MPLSTAPWRQRFLHHLPQADLLVSHPWLRPLAGLLLRPQLWHLRREAVARGAAVGMFWAFVLPFAQVLVAAAHCALWRANIPVAAAMTMVTNPLTIGFWLWLAYQLGAWVLGPQAPLEPWPAADWLAWVQAYGGPIAIGMAVFAGAGALLSYALVRLWWRWRVVRRWQLRRQR